MKSSRASELRSIVALVLLWGGAHARAQAPLAAPSPAVAQSTAPPSQTSATQGANVAGVRIVTQEGKVLSNDVATLPVQPGKPLDPRQVAESIRQLYDTGDYADLA